MLSAFEFARARPANRSTIDPSAAAIRIQRLFRGYYVRRWLIGSVRAEFQSIVDDIHRRAIVTQFRAKQQSQPFASTSAIAQDFNELNSLQSRPVQYQYKNPTTLCRPRISLPPPPPKMKFVSPIPTIAANIDTKETRYRGPLLSRQPSESLSSLHPLTTSISRSCSVHESKEEKENNNNNFDSLPNLHLSSTLQQLLRDSSLHHTDSPPMDGQGEKAELRAARPALSVGASAMDSSLAPIMTSVHASPALRAATHTMSVGVDTHSMQSNAWVDAVVVSPPSSSAAGTSSSSSEQMPPLPALPTDSRRPSQSHTPVAGSDGSNNNTILQALAQIGVPSRHHAYNEHQPGGAHFDAAQQPLPPPALPRSVVPSPLHPSFRAQQNVHAHLPQTYAVRPLDHQIQSVQAAIQQRLQVVRQQQQQQQKPHSVAPTVVSAQSSITVASQMSRTTFKTQ